MSSSTWRLGNTNFMYCYITLTLPHIVCSVNWGLYPVPLKSKWSLSFFNGSQNKPKWGKGLWKKIVCNPMTKDCITQQLYYCTCLVASSVYSAVFAARGIWALSWQHRSQWWVCNVATFFLKTTSNRKDKVISKSLYFRTENRTIKRTTA